MDRSQLDEWAQLTQDHIAEQIRQTYSERVLEHWREPHNPGPPDRWDGHARMTGECGDTMEFWLLVDDDRLASVHFMTDGCGSSLAAGSAAASLAEGLAVVDAKQVDKQRVLDHLDGLPAGEQHCAALAANTLMAAVRDYLRHRNRDSWKNLYR